jgi:hypothetical protein
MAVVQALELRSHQNSLLRVLHDEASLGFDGAVKLGFEPTFADHQQATLNVQSEPNGRGRSISTAKFSQSTEIVIHTEHHGTSHADTSCIAVPRASQDIHAIPTASSINHDDSSTLGTSPSTTSLLSSLSERVDADWGSEHLDFSAHLEFQEKESDIFDANEMTFAAPTQQLPQMTSNVRTDASSSSGYIAIPPLPPRSCNIMIEGIVQSLMRKQLHEFLLFLQTEPAPVHFPIVLEVLLSGTKCNHNTSTGQQLRDPSVE